MSGSGSPPFDPLLSKWMEDPEYKQTAQEIWKKLDKMSISDPAAYRDFMSNIGKSSASSGSTISNSSLNPDNIISSSPSSRALIRKGFTIKCRGTAVNSVSLHLINVARTKAIKKPNEKIFSAATATGSGVESVDVILSERRRGKTSSTTSTEPCHVYDAVFHSLVVDKCYDSEPFAEQLIQLAIDCVQETFKVSIHKIDVIDHHYQLPFGWDSNGKPLKDGQKTDFESTEFLDANDEDNSTSDTLTPDTMTPESLLKNLDAFSTNSVECDHKTSNLSESTTTTVNTAPTLFESLESPHPLVAPAAETSIRPSATRSPMIQMLDKDGEEDKEVESKQLFIEPEYSFETSRQKTSLKILLPLVASASQLDITYTLENSSQVWLLLESPVNGYQLHIHIPNVSTVVEMEENATVQFIKSKRVLKIQF